MLDKGLKLSATVNEGRRDGTRGWGGRYGASSLDYSASYGVSNSASSSASIQRNQECWYCRKPVHVQQHCRKCAAQGAAPVAKPKLVNKIGHNKCYHQDSSDIEQDDNNDNNHDDLLSEALNKNDQQIDLINIAALHLN